MDKDRDDKGSQNIQKTEEVSVFSDNSKLSFIHKKSEKISIAVYLVTNHLSDQEPVKWRIRNLCLELIKDIFSLRSNFSSNSGIFKSLNFHFAEIVSILDLLANAGMITSVNNEVLRQEIINLWHLFESDDFLINSPKSDFEQNFFNVPRFSQGNEDMISSFKDSLEGEAGDFFGKEEFLKDYYKGQDKGHISKRHLSFRNMSFIDSKKNSGANKKTGPDRKSLILALIRDKREVSIKDIRSSIKDCSEKTLQRDLSALIKGGVLKRKGERRWSKYILA